MSMAHTKREQSERELKNTGLLEAGQDIMVPEMSCFIRAGLWGTVARMFRLSLLLPYSPTPRWSLNLGPSILSARVEAEALRRLLSSPIASCIFENVRGGIGPVGACLCWLLRSRRLKRSAGADGLNIRPRYMIHHLTLRLLPCSWVGLEMGRQPVAVRTQRRAKHCTTHVTSPPSCLPLV